MVFAYISDIHIEFVAKNKMCLGLCESISVEDIADQFINDLSQLIDLRTQAKRDRISHVVIAGDISHCREDIITFLTYLNEKCPVPVIYVAGNHDVWGWPSSITENESKYCMGLAAEEQWLSDQILKLPNITMLRRGKYIEMSEDNQYYKIIGDLGYTGGNKEFGAEQGVYRDACTRYSEDVEFTDAWVKFYKAELQKRKPEDILIVITHTPIEDWLGTHSPDESGYVMYINGHTHGYGGYKTSYTYRDDAQTGYHEHTYQFGVLDTKVVQDELNKTI